MTISWLPSRYLVTTVMNEYVKNSFYDILPCRMEVGVFTDSMSKFVLILPSRWWFLTISIIVLKSLHSGFKKYQYYSQLPTQPLTFRHSQKCLHTRGLRIKCSSIRFQESSPRNTASGASSSSGQSSPRSSLGSLTFSSRTSNSTRSPPSSQSSIDLTTPTGPLIRPQPRIQVSSLLADAHTR
ncbi:hypothetical protein M413DRAFT_364610 [Hebeloma cylindrosporum]|uniref:Uncharacterized protein n=1 Tax=Hebeloma cylindrosporum TaxID=76867 RepID=A0A0C3CM59_HEBCY|nr:hypothetical protein M413DRAFT_364610 [Hebeloma cylindrosporum h7]